MITSDPSAEGDGEVEEEEWEEFDEDDANTTRDDADSSFDCDDEYVLDDRRKSSVEPSQTIASPPGSSHDNHSWTLMEGGSTDLEPKKIDFSAVDSSDRRKKREVRMRGIICSSGLRRCPWTTSRGSSTRPPR